MSVIEDNLDGLRLGLPFLEDGGFLLFRIGQVRSSVRLACCLELLTLLLRLAVSEDLKSHRSCGGEASDDGLNGHVPSFCSASL